MLLIHALYIHSDTGCVGCTECEAGTASNQRRTECDICGVGKYAVACTVSSDILNA